MKIAFVYDTIYPFVKGGVEKRVWELAVRFAKRNHEVHIYGMKFWDGSQTIVRDNVILHGVCNAQNLYSGGRRSVREAVYFGMGLFGPLNKEKFDVIDCQQFPYFSCLAAKCIAIKKKTPLVVTWHEVWGDYWYAYLGRAGFFGKYLERFVSRLTVHNVAVSATTSRGLRSLHPSGKIIIVPNGIDVHYIRKIPPSTDRSDIIFIGRMIKEKHVDVLVRAFATLLHEQPDLRLLLIGNGPEEKKIAELIRGLSMERSACLVGFQKEYDEMIARLKSARVCVLPSIREGFGIIALEALACGLPVVTVDHPENAIRELITEKNGFLCSLSVRDLTEKIRMALLYGNQMREACISSALLFDWDRIVSDIETYYQSVISGKC